MSDSQTTAANVASNEHNSQINAEYTNAESASVDSEKNNGTEPIVIVTEPTPIEPAVSDDGDDVTAVYAETPVEATVQEPANGTNASSESAADGEADDTRPIIYVNPGQLHKQVAETKKVLMEAGAPLFVLTGNLVSLAAVSGQIVLHPMNKAKLKPLVSEHVRYIKRTPKADVDIDPPSDIVNSLLAMPGAFPALVHVSNIPVLLEDGRLVATPGYDAASGMYYNPGPDMNGISIPDNPGMEEGQQALAKLLELTEDYDFEAEPHRYAVVAGIMTPTLRWAIPGPVPAIALDASQKGSGKSQLSKYAAILGTGEPGPMTSQCDNTEMEKRINSAVKNGALLFIVDNIDREAGGGSWEAAITARKWKGRQIGTSNEIEGDMNLCFYLTGNNMSFHDDMMRRILYARISPRGDVRDGQPRWSKPNPDAWLMAHRAEFVAAAITLCRAYILAGQPDLGLEEFPSFEKWSDTVRSAIVWAGGEDPCRSVDSVREHIDPKTEAYRVVLNIADEEFSGQEFTTKDVLDLVGTTDFPADKADVLREALETLSKGQASGSLSYKVGLAFRSRAGSIHDGHRLMRTGHGNVGTKWQLVGAN
jgi:hypothetical protein